MANEKNQTLQEEFDNIRNAYFPEWSEGQSWCAEFRDDLPDTVVGMCYPEEKRIALRASVLPWQITSGLIHEIGHAIHVNQGHNDRWIELMGGAADKARSQGHSELAEDLEMHIRDSTRMNSDAPKVDRLLYEHATQHPKEPWEEVVKCLCRETELPEKWFNFNYQDAKQFWELYKVRRDLYSGQKETQ